MTAYNVRVVDSRLRGDASTSLSMTEYGIAGLLLADERADVLNKHAHGNRVKTTLGDNHIGMFF